MHCRYIRPCARLSLPIAALLACAAMLGALETVNLPYGDAIPRFDQNATIVSVANGSWSAAGTWNPARVPHAGDVVQVRHQVSYDVVGVPTITVLGAPQNVPGRRWLHSM